MVHMNTRKKHVDGAIVLIFAAKIPMEGPSIDLVSVQWFYAPPIRS
jgi:hypothetical protein